MPSKLTLSSQTSSGRKREISEIHRAISAVYKRHGLLKAQPWTTSGEILSYYDSKFVRKGQGIVGKAFSSKSACYCRDTRHLGITEYPLHDSKSILAVLRFVCKALAQTTAFTYWSSFYPGRKSTLGVGEHCCPC